MPKDPIDETPLTGEAKMEDERSLADFITDTTPEPEKPEDFDFEQFLAGFRRTRRTVTLYQRPDLIGEMERIADLIDMQPDDADVSDLVDQFEAVRAEFTRGTPVTIEGRSMEWIEEFQKAEETTLPLPEDATPEQHAERNITVTLRQMVAQIVDPQGFTVDALRSLQETNPAEVNKLLTAMTYANVSVPESAKVLTRDFSQRRSAARRG